MIENVEEDALSSIPSNNLHHRESIRQLGNAIEMDKWLDWRVKWGQRVAVVGIILGWLFIIYGYMTVQFPFWYIAGPACHPCSPSVKIISIIKLNTIFHLLL